MNKVSYPLLTQKFIAYKGSRPHGRHFLDCESRFIKRYFIKENANNLPQIEQEIQIYQQLPTNIFFPEILSTSRHDDYIDIHFTKLSGSNVHDLLISQKKLAVLNVFDQLIEGLQFLHQQGLYHNDVRLWNMLWDEKKLALFDLGHCDVIEHENTNLALLWVIKLLHTFQFYQFSYPITEAPELLHCNFDSMVGLLITTLQKHNFDFFLNWYKTNGINEQISSIESQ